MSWHVRYHRLYEARYISYEHNIAGCTIPSVSHHNFLGVIFERCLNLSKNVRHIQKQERFLQQHLQHNIYYHR